MIRFLLQKTYKHGRKSCNRLRSYFWSCVCAEYGDKTRVLGRITVYSAHNLRIGSHSSLNEGVILNARLGLEIGDHVHVSPGVIINSAGLDYQDRGAARAHAGSPVVIADGVWIGSGALINPGVTIGEHSVVGAGAVVTKDVPDNVVVAGIPAKVIKEIPQA